MILQNHCMSSSNNLFISFVDLLNIKVASVILLWQKFFMALSFQSFWTSIVKVHDNSAQKTAVKSPNDGKFQQKFSRKYLRL